MMKKLFKRITFLNALSSLLLQVVTIISGFIIPRLILKTFGSEVNGLVSSLNQFLNYITIIEGGLTGIIAASFYKPLFDKDKKKISSVVSTANNFFKKIACIFLVYTIVLSIVYPFVVKSSFSFEYIFSLTLILSVNLFAQFFFSITWKIMLQADKKVYYDSFVQIFVIILNTVGVYLLIKFFPEIHIIKLMTSIVFLLQPLLYNYYVNKHYDIDKKAEQDKKLIKQRWDAFGINIAAFIHNNTDVGVLTLLSSLKNVSIYSTYFLVANGLKRVVSSLTTGISPTLGHIYASDDREKLNREFNNYEFVIYYFTFLMFIVGGLCVTPFVMLFTKNVTDANYYQPVFGWLLIVSELIYCLRDPYVAICYVANRFKSFTKIAFIEAGINIILSIILVSRFGIVGVAIGTLVAMTFRMFSHIFYLKKHILYRNIFVSVKKMIIFSLTSLIIVLFSYKFIPTPKIELISWVIYGFENFFTAFIVFSIVSLIFYREEFFSIVKKVKK